MKNYLWMSTAAVVIDALRNKRVTSWLYRMFSLKTSLSSFFKLLYCALPLKSKKEGKYGSV